MVYAFIFNAMMLVQEEAIFDLLTSAYAVSCSAINFKSYFDKCFSVDFW